jgi:SPP1 family predicted phage head-tail adaptor
VSGAGVPALGTLTDRIELRRRVVTDEAEGGSAAMFASLAQVWARVRPLSFSQAVVSDGRGQNVTHSVVLRFRKDLKPGDRIVYRGAVLDVLGVADLNGRRAYLSCQCSERVVTG